MTRQFTASADRLTFVQDLQGATLGLNRRR
jgi:hypothetical protein